MDAMEQEIMDMARTANDPKDRTYLLLLLRIVTSLEANTATTKEISAEILEHRAGFEQHRVEFRKHVEDEAALFNQGRGMWRMWAAFFGLAQIVGFSVVTWYIRQQAETTTELKGVSAAVIQSQAKHEQLDLVDRQLRDVDRDILERILRIERKVYGQ